MFKNGMIALILATFASSLHAADDRLACKLYNDELSAQLRVESTRTANRHQQATLVFTKAVAWYEDLTRFQLVYASDSQPNEPKLVIANAVSVGGQPQTVIINLEAIRAGTNTRYGILQAGDFSGDVASTLKKRRTYEIQCFYSE